MVIAIRKLVYNVVTKTVSAVLIIQIHLFFKGVKLFMRIIWGIVLGLCLVVNSYSQNKDEFHDFVLDNNRPLIKVEVNGKPFNFMLDIGASGIGRIDERIVKEMNLKTVGFQDNSDGINTTQLPLIGIDSLKFGSIEMKNIELMSRDYNRTKRETLTDGIIGREFFEKYLLTIDYPNKKVSFSQNSLNPKSKNVLRYERPFVVKGKIGKTEYEFHLDSGSNLDFHFPKKIIEKLRFEDTGEVTTARRANTEFKLHGAIIKENFQLAKVKLKTFKAYYSEPQTWINVGGETLKSRKLTIDQKNKCLKVE